MRKSIQAGEMSENRGSFRWLMKLKMMDHLGLASDDLIPGLQKVGHSWMPESGEVWRRSGGKVWKYTEYGVVWGIQMEFHSSLRLFVPQHSSHSSRPSER